MFHVKHGHYPDEPTAPWDQPPWIGDDWNRLPPPRPIGFMGDVEVVEVAPDPNPPGLWLKGDDGEYFQPLYMPRNPFGFRRTNPYR